MAADRGGGSYNADFAVARFSYGGVSRGIDHTRVWYGELFLKGRARDRAYGAAGGNDHLYIAAEQKLRVLKGVFANGIAAARSVGHTSRIAEVNDFFGRQYV